MRACAETGTLALAGAPVAGRHIATLAVDGDGARVAYRKRWVHGDEVGRFEPGDPPTAIEVDGLRVGLGICRDTGVDEHVEGVAALGLDLYVAGVVHLPERARRAGPPRRADRPRVPCPGGAGQLRRAHRLGLRRRPPGPPRSGRADGSVAARAGADPGDFARACAQLTANSGEDLGCHLAPNVVWASACPSPTSMSTPSTRCSTAPAGSTPWPSAPPPTASPRWA